MKSSSFSNPASALEQYGGTAASAEVIRQQARSNSVMTGSIHHDASTQQILPQVIATNVGDTRAIRLYNGS